MLRYPLLLDTFPSDPPSPLKTVPPLAQPYLALSQFPVAVPRPFTQIVLPDTNEPLLLLDEVPLQIDLHPASEVPTLLPSLKTAWAQASALYQVTWLWQLARLWQPLIDNHVAGTVLDWSSVRVDAEDIRLLSLQAAKQVPTMADMGAHWRDLVSTAAKPLRTYLGRLTDELVSGVGSAAGLVHSLTRALEILSANQELSVQFATHSDQGPTRPRNEDACYPQTTSTQSVSVNVATTNAKPAPLIVVCDGIGGHQGGNIASHIAIDEVTQYLHETTATPNLSQAQVVSALEQAILTANQAIVARNNAAKKQDRDRMGTTIVMALVYGARLYIAHLGDSRAYRVRLHSCRQVTLDDDVASREMRLGLGLYHDALQAPGSGALVQALGMVDARHLHPTVELYPLATPSVFLLCSDGLSDYGLVDRLWSTELRPLLTGEQGVETATKRLIELANTHNGHDNVTVALLQGTPKSLSSRQQTTVPADVATLLTVSAGAESAPINQTMLPTLSTSPPAPKQRRSLPWLLAGTLVVVLLSILGAYYWEQLTRQAMRQDLAETNGGEILSPSAAPPTTTRTPSTAEVSVGDYLQIQSPPEADTALTVVVTTTPPVPEPPAAVDVPQRSLPNGSTVKVINRQKTPDNQVWVRLEVCSVSTEATGVIRHSNGSSPSTVPTISPTTEGDRSLPLVQPGDQGWLLEPSLPVVAEALPEASPTQKGLCTD